MNRSNILFPKLGGILHGGDYNPEQWLDRPDILAQDIKLMKKAGINCATLGVFSWSSYEPKEGEFHFDWLKEIMDNLYKNGIYTILATPSGARPAWMDKKYPECMRVDNMGMRIHHGIRHNHCKSSPIMREKSAIINAKLAENFAHHPGLLLWHISNEFGGDCYCPICTARFQAYLADKFEHDIAKLNQAWWTGFWSHTYTDFSEIEPPFSNGEDSILGLNLEWMRFNSFITTESMKAEIDTVRKYNPDIPVTTNFMKIYDALDYREMAKELDIISWDAYPLFQNDYEPFSETMLENAFDHALMRSMKPDRPFMLMESAPGLVNWHQYNKVKKTGTHKLACLQAIASGSDTVQYFQWRKGRGCAEQYHGAVIDHLGTDDTRIFKEVAEVGSLLKKIPEIAGSTMQNKVALLFDWDNRWAIKDMRGLSNETKNYEATCLALWKQMLKMGVEADIISQDDDFNCYQVIIAPMLYLLHDNTADKMQAFVKNGGQLLATYLTGYVDKNTLCYLGGFPGNGLSDLFGIISEEIDTLYPSEQNHIHFLDQAFSPSVSLGDGVCDCSIRDYEVRDYVEMLRVNNAKILAEFTDDYYKGNAAITVKNHGTGNAYYVAARMTPADMSGIFEQIFSSAGIVTKKLPNEVETLVRYGDENSFTFYFNYSTSEKIIENMSGFEMLGGQPVEGVLTLAPLSVAIIKN